MKKASEVATELRMLADCLDKAPDAEFCHEYLSFQPTDKGNFKAIAAVWPRPFKKTIDFPNSTYEDLVLVHGSMRLKIQRTLMCTLVEPALPAVYRCDPILSEDEEAELKSA